MNRACLILTPHFFIWAVMWPLYLLHCLCHELILTSHDNLLLALRLVMQLLSWRVVCPIVTAFTAILIWCSNTEPPPTNTRPYNFTSLQDARCKLVGCYSFITVMVHYHWAVQELMYTKYNMHHSYFNYKHALSKNLGPGLLKWDAYHGWSLFLFSSLRCWAFREEPFQCSQSCISLSHLFIGSCALELLPVDLHLHDKTFVVAAAGLWYELILEASTLLIQLHHWVLAVFSEDWSLLASSLIRKSWWVKWHIEQYRKQPKSWLLTHIPLQLQCFLH